MLGFDIKYLIFALGGGTLGAAFGGLNAFILCGLTACIGAVVTLTTGDSAFFQIVTLGPLLGPHIMFAGGVAASAFAAKKGKLETGRDVSTALFGLNLPAVLVMGGIFGGFGYVIKWGLELIPGFGGYWWINTIALSITINALVVRILFGKTGLFGKVKKGSRRWLIPEDGAWHPWQSRPSQLIIVAFGVGLPSAYIAKLLPGSIGLVFGITAVSLLFLQFGARIPVVLHIALSVELVCYITKDIGWSLVFGILAAVFADLFASLFLTYGDTHIDPPAMSLVVTFLLYPILKDLGLFRLSGMITVLIALSVGIAAYVLLSILRGVSPLFKRL